MKEISCGVIRDLLPLYEDGAVSTESQELVREHLKDCPGCREELRRMRTPVSLPPEDEGELWARFQARRDRQRKKRRIAMGCALSLLAALVVFCLWYTRPRASGLAHRVMSSRSNRSSGSTPAASSWG